MGRRLKARERYREGNTISQADVFLKVIVAVFLMFFMANMLLLLQKTKKEGDIVKKAEYMITLEWDKDIPCDMDLYVNNPAGNTIWYNNKSVQLMNLERDDLGQANDSVTLETGRTVPNNENKEYTFIRGILPGTYTVNVQVFACKSEISGVEYTQGEVYPPGIPVTVQLIRLNPSMKVSYSDTFTFTKIKQERTMFNFDLGDLGAANFRRIPKKLAQNSDGDSHGGRP